MKILKWLGIVVGALALVVVLSVVYFKHAAAKLLSRPYSVKVAEIPIPYPLTEAELDELRRQRASQTAPGAAGDPLASVDLSALALERALARGEHYFKTRAGCADCHGEDLGGKVIVENPVMGKWVAPNITRGGVTKNYRPADWVRIIRHGILPSGLPALMPSTDFAGFSDQEISDIVAYVQSRPPVAREMPRSELGPMYAALIATAQIPISAAKIDHQAPRPKVPPAIAATVELGRHLGNTCTGCHGPSLSGGPIPGGDPSWPPARNLTFDPTGIGSWSLDDFRKALKQGVRPDGTMLDPAMPVAYTARMATEEIDALYLYFKTLPKQPFGNH